MSGDRLSPSNDKISIKPKRNRNGTFFEPADFDYKDSTPVENDKRADRISEPQSSDIISTKELISAISYVWDLSRQPLSVLQSKYHSKSKTEVVQGSDILHYAVDKGAFRTCTSADDQPCTRFFNVVTNYAKLGPESVDYVKKNRKMSCPQPNYGSFSSWRLFHANSAILDKFSAGKCFSSRGISPSLRSNYAWMSKMDPAKLKNQVNCVRTEDKTISNHDTCDKSTNPTSGCLTTNSTNSFNNLAMRISNCIPKVERHIDLLNGKALGFDSMASTTTCSENKILHTENIQGTDSEIFTSRFDPDSQDTISVSRSHDCESVVKETEDLLDHRIGEEIAVVKTDTSEVEIGPSVREETQCALAKREHAFAGAMAGICVSLCLHPIDTIKTVIQSCRADQKPLCYIGRSIVCERGVTGLYRGISSNIITSAPISAIYTYTYESVKKSLLPLLPKENYAFAHCMAGGCASIATSFIFTPSERIKQQMQVGSHYRNCWTALIEVVKKGGLPSLYTGWGAVLCRNVPHSIIKFYTYESLKEIMSPFVQPTAQANTLVTLFCGGLAGSMASLFTTPFDVVKTRLQTQIPGSTTQYDGVFNTLTKIGKNEGVKGLYRGLNPRLVMYMIQGSLFFASYESFKALFALDVPQLSIQHPA